MLVEKRNFAELAGESARDYFEKRHEAGLRVGRHGEATLERSSAVSSADPGAEDEGVVAVEGDGWLDVDGSRRVRHVISGEIPYLARQLPVF
jgi:methionine synthase II (cobalamin-independent)